MPHRDAFDEALHAAKSGDPDALAMLYRLVHPRVLRYLRVLELQEAEDLASETWLDLVRALERFRGDERAVVGLALTIARRRAIGGRRRRDRRGTMPVEPQWVADHGPVGDVEDDALERIGLDEAVERLRALPPDQADIVLLRVLGGLSAEQVARIVGKRPGTVRVLQHRALRALARSMVDRTDPMRRVTP